MTDVKQGDFYIPKDECIVMGCCGGWGPELFQCSDKASFVKKQPENDEELAKMFRASRTCAVECILYRGADPLLKEHFLAINYCHKKHGPKRCELGDCPCFDAYIEARNKG